MGLSSTEDEMIEEATEREKSLDALRGFLQDEELMDSIHGSGGFLQNLCGQLAASKGFHDVRQFDGVTRTMSIGERIALIHSEASEALEAYREKKGVAGYTEIDGKPEGVPSEIADVVIRCFDFAFCYDIDLTQVILQKLAYNAGRPMHHGGKAL